MARMIPPVFDPLNPSDGERTIFERLRDDPGTSDWVVLHSQDIAHHVRQVVGEADFVVLIPAKGVVCLEIKGHKKARREGGAWYLGNDGPNYRGPFKQALEAMSSVVKRVKARRPDLTGTPFTWAVIFPFVSSIQRLDTDEWLPWQLVTSSYIQNRSISTVLTNIIDSERTRLVSVPSAKWFDPNANALTHGQGDAIAAILRPDFELCETSASAATRRENEVRRYTEEQFVALDAMERNERVIFDGPAGTGKTLLALEAARREAIDGKRVLLLCYNQLLSRWLREQGDLIGAPINIRTLHGLMTDIAGAPTPNDEKTGAQFWEADLPHRALTSLLNEDDSRYDTIIIDEAQDVLAPQYLDVLDCLVHGGLQHGRWRLFGDLEHQAIYGDPTNGQKELERRAPMTPRYSLRINCRNTPRIVRFVHLLSHLDPPYSKTLRPDTDGNPRLMYYASPAKQTAALEKCIHQLLDDGLLPREIVVLSGTKRSCASTVADPVLTGMLQPLSDRQSMNTIGYGTIHAFKGLDRAAVIITDIHDVDTTLAKSLFYTGMTRATNRLVLLLDECVRFRIVEILSMEGSTNG